MERANTAHRTHHGHALRARAKQFAAFVRYVAARYQKDGASRMATALSYTSLLSLVPLLAIALAMLAAFPVFDSIRRDLMTLAFQNFVPAVGNVIQAQVDRFIANAGRLTAAGVVGLVFTAVMLLVTIEGAFNQVFRVARERSPVAKLLVYWTVLTLGPLLIGTAFSLQGYVAAARKWQFADALSPLLTVPLPLLLTILAFTGLFATIPNRRVRIRDALAGAVVAAILFAALRWGFSYYITSSKAYTNLYGAVAVVPIFLFWMFLSWAVVLVGAEVTAALPEWRAGYQDNARKAVGARRLTLALEVLAHLARALADNTKGLSRRDLLAAMAVSEREVNPVLTRLCVAGFAARLANGRFLLARDMERSTLHDLIAALDLDLALDDTVATTASWRAATTPLIEAARTAHHDALNVPLRSLLI